MNGDILFPALIIQRRKAVWTLLSSFQTSIVLLPSFAIFRTLDSDLCPSVTITFGDFLSCAGLCLYFHIQSSGRARLSVLSCVIILDLPSLSPFLIDICRFKLNVSQRETVLVKILVPKGGKTFFFFWRFFGHATPLDLIPGSPMRQIPQGVEKEEVLSDLGGLSRLLFS